MCCRTTSQSPASSYLHVGPDLSLASCMVWDETLASQGRGAGVAPVERMEPNYRPVCHLLWEKVEGGGPGGRERGGEGGEKSPAAAAAAAGGAARTESLASCSGRGRTVKRTAGAKHVYLRRAAQQRMWGAGTTLPPWGPRGRPAPPELFTDPLEIRSHLGRVCAAPATTHTGIGFTKLMHFLTAGIWGLCLYSIKSTKNKHPTHPWP